MAEVKGVNEVLAKLKEKKVGYKQALADAINVEAYAIEAASVLQVPVDTGRLRSSHYVAVATADEPVATIGYNVDYAEAVHERTDVPHKTGNAKFLETPFNAAREGLMDRIAKRVKQKMDR